MMNKFDTMFLDIAKTVSELSHDSRTKVGAVIVKDGNVLSFGYNGMPSGFPNDCKDDNGSTKPEVIHAEVNAIYKLAKNGGGANGATLYCTHSPCVNCALAIIQSGITTVIYSHKRANNGLYLFEGRVNLINHIQKEK